MASSSGTLRISATALDRAVTVAASTVHGVLATESALGAAVIGGAALGSAVGLVHGGPVGAALGASVGSAAGAAAAHLLREQRLGDDLAPIDQGTAPALTVRLTARYGEDLQALTARVREQVRADLEAVLGLKAGPVHVEIVDVVDPARSPLGAQTLP